MGYGSVQQPEVLTYLVTLFADALKGHGFSRAAKASALKGHGFSRAVKAPKMIAGFSPCAMPRTRVPHPRRVSVFAARVGSHKRDPRPVILSESPRDESKDLHLPLFCNMGEASQAAETLASQEVLYQGSASAVPPRLPL